ncbi:hypothetical protein G2W53_002388 [Senna tora]|uniref:Uncharacterized protein n=1 Tax=Senna tora TaxID=362788 RepID=A0A834XHF9_9FABA|nr:hypothetical protein G2W53_002388 [Senna tora]
MKVGGKVKLAKQVKITEEALSVDLDAEILAREGLAELPISGCHVAGGGGASVTACDSNGKSLTHQIGIGLPILPPVTCHAHPACFGSFYTNAHDIPCTRHVGDQNQVEVTEPVHCESDSTYLSAWHPDRHEHGKRPKAKRTNKEMSEHRWRWVCWSNRGKSERILYCLPAVTDGDDPGTVLSDLEVDRHSEVEVRTRRVAPSAIVAGKSEIRRAEVGTSNDNGRISRVTPFGITNALDLETRTAAQAIVEESRAECRRVHTVSLTVEISVTTSTT